MRQGRPVDRIVLGNQHLHPQRFGQAAGGLRVDGDGLAAQVGRDDVGDVVQAVCIRGLGRQGNRERAGRHHVAAFPGGRRGGIGQHDVHQHVVGRGRQRRRIRQARVRTPVAQPAAGVFRQFRMRGAHLEADTGKIGSGRRIAFQRRFQRQIQFQREATAGAGLAVQRDSSSHQLRQSHADGQAQAGPPELVFARINLIERLEQARAMFVVDAHAGVGHLDAEARLAFPLAPRPQAHDHVAGPGELDGVADQVVEDLADPSRISAQRGRNVRIDAGEQQELLLPGHRGVGGYRILHQLARTERFRFQHHLAGFDAGGVEDVADQLEQDGRGTLDRRQVASLLFAERGEFEQFQRSQHAVERRADLVAHGGQEGGFGGAGAIGVAPGAFERALDLRAGTDVGERAQDHVLLAIAGGRIGDLQHRAVA